MYVDFEYSGLSLLYVSNLLLLPNKYDLSNTDSFLRIS